MREEPFSNYTASQLKVVYEVKNVGRSDIWPNLMFFPEMHLEKLGKYKENHRITGLVVKIWTGDLSNKMEALLSLERYIRRLLGC
jgi:hypothetical protein